MATLAERVEGRVEKPDRRVSHSRILLIDQRHEGGPQRGGRAGAADLKSQADSI